MYCIDLKINKYKAYLSSFNEGKSAASFCRQMAALVPAMFCNFYLVKNHKIADNPATTEAREKTNTYLESLDSEWKSLLHPKCFNVEANMVDSKNMVLIVFQVFLNLKRN
jgi:hypothetical protein